MFYLIVDKTKIDVVEVEELTCNALNVFKVQFEFGDDWKGCSRTALFRVNGGNPFPASIDQENKCVIPWEVLLTHGHYLEVSVRGCVGNDVVLPSEWKSLGKIQEGACLNEEVPYLTQIDDLIGYVPYVIANDSFYAVGEPIVVSCESKNISGKDWVGIYKKGETTDPNHGGAYSIYWAYCSDFPAGGLEINNPEKYWRIIKNNVAGRGSPRSDWEDFQNGLPAGEYTIFLLENDGYGTLAAVPIVIGGESV